MTEEKHKLTRQTSIASVIALLLFVLSAVAVATPTVVAQNSWTPTTLSIGGSTLLAPLATVWATNFQTYTGGAVSVNYQAVGSTAGNNNFLSDIFSLGFSDAPIPQNGLATLNAQGDVVTPANSPPVTGLAGADPVIQVVDALAPVSIFYNIPGFRGTLNLTGDVVSEIFLQHITSWTDPHILALNPGLTSAQIALLGKYPITVVHRSDGSGTSFALTNYFGKIDGNWTADGYSGNSTSASNFPASELSGKGTGGVAGTVAATNGAVGYGETSYAIGGGLVYAAIQNSAGNYILPLPAGVTAAAAADAGKLATDPVYVITNAPGAESYPISTYTYAFIWENQDLGTSGGGAWTQGLAFDAVQFLNWAVTQGQAYSTNLQYAPLPPAVVTLDLGLLAKVNYGGASFLKSPTASITCKSSSVLVGKTDSCTAVLSGGSGLTGDFLWSSTAAGTFNKPVCVVPKNGKCTATFTAQGASPSETIAAEFTGDLNNAPAIASSSLTVTQMTSKTSVSCKPSSATTGSAITCTAKVTGYAPTGTVNWSQSGAGSVAFSSTSCLLSTVKNVGTCSVTVTGNTAGKVTLTATYAGDGNNKGSSKTASVTIKA
ncbi:MAG: phosphate ABC transporter substrate-binding protein PstS [Nitrososphaerales archaeon]